MYGFLFKRSKLSRFYSRNFLFVWLISMWSSLFHLNKFKHNPFYSLLVYTVQFQMVCMQPPLFPISFELRWSLSLKGEYKRPFSFFHQQFPAVSRLDLEYQTIDWLTECKASRKVWCIVFQKWSIAVVLFFSSLFVCDCCSDCFVLCWKTFTLLILNISHDWKYFPVLRDCLRLYFYKCLKKEMRASK